MTQVIFKTRRIKPTPIATEENQAMTIPTPIKESNPELYARHVKHFTKAKAFTYNYYPQDEVILENYSTMTIKEIAHMLNEYVERIKYRVFVLRSVGILTSKRTRRTKVELALATLNAKKEFHQVELRQVRRQIKDIAA
jgi:hypothetical protein